MNGFHLTIASVGSSLFDAVAQSCTLPGSEGVFTVLAEHEPFITTLKKGTLTVVDEKGEKRTFECQESGVCEVSNNTCMVLL
jgi:F-type H+-transporting ATPase subunit epsilon